jgi:hypothetical protein
MRWLLLSIFTLQIASAACPSRLPAGLHCAVFPEGCVYVPTSANGPALVYFRGLIQDSPRSPPESTQALFDLNRNYRLKIAADTKKQILLATHKSTTALSSATLRCLKSLSHNNKVDVASHSGGGVGLSASKNLLEGQVSHLHLLDNFYGRETLRTAVLKIGPSSCSGFYTSHALANLRSISAAKEHDTYQIRGSNCVVNKASSHIGQVVPSLLGAQRPSETPSNQDSRNSH